MVPDSVQIGLRTRIQLVVVCTRERGQVEKVWGNKRAQFLQSRPAKKFYVYGWRLVDGWCGSALGVEVAVANFFFVLLFTHTQCLIQLFGTFYELFYMSYRVYDHHSARNHTHTVKVYIIELCSCWRATKKKKRRNASNTTYQPHKVLYSFLGFVFSSTY